jgi:hypothetical protein
MGASKILSDFYFELAEENRTSKESFAYSLLLSDSCYRNSSVDPVVRYQMPFSFLLQTG